ncbi:hypothetical protein EV356DRAFT_575241 [Viridothelium virens]|uniref:Uncharacterized protein n=1 Tax=Viridothelium virens TaxID=1048519 RepID=A0A6A6HEQ8_VIRVR|nr:hypothetical protein EV356DRAFT_575241 [Viridothelium virens]
MRLFAILVTFAAVVNAAPIVRRVPGFAIEERVVYPDEMVNYPDDYSEQKKRTTTANIEERIVYPDEMIAYPDDYSEQKKRAS